MKTDLGGQIVYFLCPCGSIFHDEPLNKGIYTPEYVGRARDDKFFHAKLDLIRRVYMPTIEHHSFGRESLEIGFGFAENIVEMRRRGWHADGIDIIPNDYTTGDFETFDFKDVHFDLVIMSHVLKCFEDPVKGLRKAISLIKTGGLLLLMEPNAGLCLTYGYGSFGNWGHESRTLLTMERAILECVRAGMEPRPLVSISNIGRQFLHTNDFHLLLRKGMK